ncbi:MAG: hypothetical protein I3J02_08315 [Prevotella sp.]|nr:hypothetical protein [Prevotella sp.]
MARPIKTTPLLIGEDAEDFLENNSALQPTTGGKQERVKGVYTRFKVIAALTP